MPDDEDRAREIMDAFLEPLSGGSCAPGRALTQVDTGPGAVVMDGSGRDPPGPKLEPAVPGGPG